MRTFTEKFRNPIPLHDRLAQRAIEAGYENVSEYLVGLVRYDFLTRKKHYATMGISKLTRAEQDKIDDETARMFDTGETLNGSWFEARIKEASETVANGQNLPVNKVVDELLRRIA